MKKHVRPLIALLMILALLLPLFPVSAARAEEENTRTTYDEGATYTIDFEPEAPAAAESADEGLVIGDLPLTAASGDLLEQSDLTFAEEEPDRPDQNAESSMPGSGVLLNDLDLMPRQLTIEDIQAMNPDSLVIDCYTNEGYLSTLVGKFYEGRVTNQEEGIESIQGLAAMLGLSKGSKFFAVYKETNHQTGYTFYTYQQRYGNYTLRYATLRIVVDPDGYTAGLSCSFVPNVGMASDEPSSWPCPTTASW